MTDQEVREAAKEWIKAETNNDFIDPDTGEENLPGGVELALELMVDNFDGPTNIQSKKHRKMSITYFPAKVSQKVMDLIKPYRNLSW